MRDHPPTIDAEPRLHQSWMDNVRVALIAGVIVVHSATGYVTDIAGWYYDDEMTSSEVWSAVRDIPVLLGGVFGLTPMFFIAGCLSVRSLARRGRAGLVRARIVRLGGPLLLFILVIHPIANYLGNLHQESFGFLHYVRNTEVSVTWFVAALLVYSMVFAAVPRRLAAFAPVLRPRVLVGIALACGFLSFALWLVVPLDSRILLNGRVGEWPLGLVVFAMGVFAANARWLDHISAGTQRRVRWAALVGFGALLALLVAASLGDDDVATRADVPTFLFAMVMGWVAVAFTVWFVSWIRHRWPTRGPLLAKAGRGSYATYVIHPLALVLTMLAMRPVPLVPEVKFVVVAALAIPICFTIGYAVTRVPGINKVV